MDSIWINEIYRLQCDNLIDITNREIALVHTLTRFEELSEKKETFRKALNLVN